MLKKTLLVSLLLFSLNISNGYYRTTRIQIEGINGVCYGTLLSEKTTSGSWSTQNIIDLYAPKEIIEAFKEYKNDYFYLNYFQDVSEGLLYWPIYPPEKFKLLLYYPESKTFIVSDVTERYALTSQFKAIIDSNNNIDIIRNYNYLGLSLITIIRIIIGAAVSIVVSILYGKPNRDDVKYFILTNLIFHIILNIFISIYSYKNGFSIVEYYLFLWFVYLVFFVIQSIIYQRNLNSTDQPIVCALLGNIAAYFVGLLLVDIFPALFTIL